MTEKHGLRTAISPIMTVLIIVNTIVAGVAIAGFAFERFGTASATADVSATPLVCSHGSAATSKCLVMFQNTGNAPVSAVACSLGGATSTLPSAPVSIPPGQASGAACKVAAGMTVPGQAVEGTFTLSDGTMVSFSGTYT